MFFMFERFEAGFSAAKDCWNVLRQQKSLLLFPLLSCVSCILILMSFLLPLAWESGDWFAAIKWLSDLFNDDGTGDQLLGMGIVFAFYFVNYFVIYYFNAALVHCCLFRLRNIDVGIVDGLMSATRRIPALIAWSLVSATVGLLLHLLERTSERAGNFIGQIVSSVLGAAWTVSTFFVVPVLVIERVGPFKAIQRSLSVVSRTWGENIGVNLGIGFFMLPFWLIGFGAVYFTISVLSLQSPAGMSMALVLAGYFFVLGLMQSTLDTILRSALYLYATQGEIPDQWKAATLEQAFYAKSSDG